MTNVRVKPINELEVKSEVSVNDKILILDSVSEEARLASKDELKGDKGDKWDTWSTWPQGVPWTPWTPWKDWEDWEDGKDWNWITSVTSTKVWKTTTVTMNFDEWDPFSFEVQDWEDGGGGGWSWDVVWPASSTDWHLAVFDWATWKIIKDWWAMPTIPTKVSDLSNDAGYLTSSTWVSSFNWNTWAVTYTAPVSSVNNQTWAVTVSEFSASAWGTKVFDYPTTSVEDIVTWCNGWWTAILMKSDWPYVVSKVGTNYITSVRDNSWDWWTFGTWSVKVDMLTYNNTYALTSSNNVATYNHFQPWGTATTGYVVTKTANGYEWSAPSGWDVMVSSQTGNILTSWMKIWAGTETNYWNLGTYDSNCLYLVIE